MIQNNFVIAESSKGDNMILLEKYKPEQLDNMLKKEEAKKIKELVEKKGRFIISGPVGCGKSLALELVAKEMKHEIIHTTDETLGTKLDFMKQGSLFFKGKIIVVDLDLIHSLEKLESMMKSTPYPIVYTSTDIYQKKYYELRKKHTLIRFQKIADFAMYNLLTSICKKEQIPYSDFAIKHLVRLCESDIRAAIISLCCLKEEGITPESVKSIAEYKTSDVFQTLLNIFGNDLKKARESLSNTEQDILPWIEANANDSTSLSATENIAKADLFKARVMKRQAWNLEKYYYDMIAGISARKICKKRFDPPFARKPEK